MRLFGSLAELVAAVFRKNNQQVTLRPNQTTTYTADRDLQLPQADSDQVVVGRSSTDTGTGRLQNKELDDSSVLFVDNADTTKKLAFQVSGVTTATTRTLAVPDASDTIAVLATAQVLTNKTIDSDLNTITNIVNADIKALAAIDSSKIADGSVDNTEFQRLGTAGTAGAGNLLTTDGTQSVSNKTLEASTLLKSGFTIEESGGADTLTFLVQAQSASRNVNIQALSSNDDFVFAAQSQALTNKTISGASNTISNINLASQVTGTLPIGNGGTGQTSQTAAFDALAPTTTKGDLIASNGTDNIRVAVGTDGFALVADSAAASGLSYAAVATDALAEFNMKVGNNLGSATAVNTSTTGDILGSSVNGLSIQQIVTNNTTQLTTKTITTGKTVIYPRMTVGSGHTWTFNSGSYLYVYDVLVLTGTLVMNGNSVVTNMGIAA